MKILVTGAAGFIGFHVVKTLLKSGHEVVGLDNINAYYSIDLKFDRLKELGIPRKNAEVFNQLYTNATTNKEFSFIRMNIEDETLLFRLCKEQNFDKICHLAAQAGVRYSIENPRVYINSNIVGFLNILECCRNYKIKHLVYASSSSVYGLNSDMPFSTTDAVDHPISLYAATKKSNELMAHTYSHLFGFVTTGLRFFTVYGPWGRPDMALYLFTDAIVKGKPIQVFNNGEMARDFTYIDDITDGVVRIMEKPADRVNKYKIYNIGSSKPVKLTEFITEIEHNLGLKAIQEFLPLQPGDVEKTFADIDELKQDYGYSPKTTIAEGVQAFVLWYKNYY